MLGPVTRHDVSGACRTDGSGNAGDGSNDVLVTTAAQAKVGDVVTLAGTVRTDKDFGSGYSYKVLVEDAKLEP